MTKFLKIHVSFETPITLTRGIILILKNLFFFVTYTPLPFQSFNYLKPFAINNFYHSIVCSKTGTMRIIFFRSITRCGIFHTWMLIEHLYQVIYFFTYYLNIAPSELGFDWLVSQTGLPGGQVFFKMLGNCRNLYLSSFSLHDQISQIPPSYFQINLFIYLLIWILWN